MFQVCILMICFLQFEMFLSEFFLRVIRSPKLPGKHFFDKMQAQLKCLLGNKLKCHKLFTTG